MKLKKFVAAFLSAALVLTSLSRPAELRKRPVAGGITAYASKADSQYAERIKNSHSNEEVPYDGSSFVTELDYENSPIKPLISIKRK